MDPECDHELKRILLTVVGTPISQELVPIVEGTWVPEQLGEDAVGPYGLHDFFLCYTIRFGFTRLKLILILARQAWGMEKLLVES